MNARFLLSSVLADKAAEDIRVEPEIDRDHPVVVWLQGEPWIATAVLERTIVLISTRHTYVTRTARFDEVMVEPFAWRPRTSTYEGHRLNTSQVHKVGARWRNYQSDDEAKKRGRERAAAARKTRLAEARS